MVEVAVWGAGVCVEGAGLTVWTVGWRWRVEMIVYTGELHMCERLHCSKRPSLRVPLLEVVQHCRRNFKLIRSALGDVHLRGASSASSSSSD